MDQATPPLTHLIRPLDDPYVPWPGLILLALSTNVWYCCTNQFYIQSCLGAKDERHGRLGVLLTAALAPVLTLCFAFPGYIANDLIGQGVLPPLPLGDDGLPDANATYPHLVEHLLGPGLRGFIVVAAIGAIMSSVAAVTNATASVFTNDLYHRWIRPASSDRHLVTVGRITGIVTLAVAFPLTLFAAKYQYIFTYSQNAWCILAIPIMLVFTYGILWKRATNRAAAATLIVLAPFVAVPFVCGNRNDNFLDLPFVAGRVHLFNFAFVLWLAAGAFMFVASLLTRPPTAKTVAPYIWSPDMLRPDDGSKAAPRWFQRVGFWCLVAAIFYVILYIIYW
jgi:SSS family solute:Na+ symporter